MTTADEHLRNVLLDREHGRRFELGGETFRQNTYQDHLARMEGIFASLREAIQPESARPTATSVRPAVDRRRPEPIITRFIIPRQRPRNRGGTTYRGLALPASPGLQF